MLTFSTVVVAVQMAEADLDTDSKCTCCVSMLPADPTVMRVGMHDGCFELFLPFRAILSSNAVALNEPEVPALD